MPATPHFSNLWVSIRKFSNTEAIQRDSHPKDDIFTEIPNLRLSRIFALKYTQPIL